MPDARFFMTLEPLRVAEAMRLAGVGGADIEGLILRAGSLDEEDLSGAVVFVDRLDRVADAAARGPALLFAPPGADGARVAAVKDPRAAYAAAARALHRERGAEDGGPAPRIRAGSKVDPSASIGPGAEIGAGSVIGTNAVIGPGVILGENTVIGPNAVIDCAIIGNDCRIGPGAVIGGPGFGFAPGPSGVSRIPQLGRVLLGDRVEIGANSTIDRGAIGDTVIGAGTKLDNLVQIGHNVRLGRDCLLAAQVGIAGSTLIGDRVMFGGQAGIADHLTIGDDARLAARAGLMHDVPAGETWGGAPARPIRLWMKEIALLARMVRSPGKARDGNKD